MANFNQSIFPFPRMNPREHDILHELQEMAHRQMVLWAELAEIREAEKREQERTDDVDFSMFKETTARLLTEFWNAPDKMLSQEDIRQDVILDEEASDAAVKMVVKRARAEMKAKRFRYVIKSVFNKGYQVVPKVTKSNKTRNTLAGVG